MQEEIDSLSRRLKGVEDEIIELMEYVEPLDAQLAESAAERTVLDQRAQSTIGKITEQEVVIDGELASVRGERDAIATGVPADVMDMYEGLRRSFAGVGVVRLEHGVCGGCHLALARAEVDRIKHLAPDVPVHCEECGRLLVH
jgi:predicted  nucleic acid-binding Zn-ribbon protein